MAVAPTEIRTLARSYTKAAINTLVGIMRQPKAPAAARVMAANALLDRGWGKAAQFVDVQGEIKQLVAVQLNVVRSDSIAHNPSAAISEQKPQAIEIIEGNCSESTHSSDSSAAPGDAPAK